MTQDLKLVQEKIRKGELDPDQALEEFDNPFKALKDIRVRFDIETLDTGLKSLNKYQYIRKNEADIITIAARPGAGKTSLLCQIGFYVASYGNVLMFSAEMAQEELKRRLLSFVSNTSLKRLKAMPASKRKDAEDKMSRLSFNIDDTDGIDIDTLVARVKEYAKKNKVELILIDYIQIIKTRRPQSKKEQVAECMEKLKGLANALTCPIIVLAQMNRMFDIRLADNPTAVPMMSDIADASEVEHWSDVIFAMHKRDTHDIKIYTLKNRHGESKEISLQYSGEFYRFFDVTQSSAREGL